MRQQLLAAATKRTALIGALLLAGCGGNDDSLSVHDSLTVFADPASVSIAPGASADVDVLLERTGSFTSASVALGVSGEPAGVTASFDTINTTDTFATLTITVDGTAATGDTSLTITAQSGSTSKSAELTLTVTAPGHITTH